MPNCVRRFNFVFRKVKFIPDSDETKVICSINTDTGVIIEISNHLR